jgi:hypothetical protein
MQSGHKKPMMKGKFPLQAWSAAPARADRQHAGQSMSEALRGWPARWLKAKKMTGLLK